MRMEIRATFKRPYFHPILVHILYSRRHHRKVRNPLFKIRFFRASNSKNSCSYDRLKFLFFSPFFYHPKLGRRPKLGRPWSSPTSPQFRSSVWLLDFTEAGHTYESHWHGFVGTDLSVVGFHHHFPRAPHPLDHHRTCRQCFWNDGWAARRCGWRFWIWVRILSRGVTVSGRIYGIIQCTAGSTTHTHEGLKIFDGTWLLSFE